MLRFDRAEQLVLLLGHWLASSTGLNRHMRQLRQSYSLKWIPSLLTRRRWIELQMRGTLRWGDEEDFFNSLNPAYYHQAVLFLEQTNPW